jgi:hypothetical protein
MAAALTAAVSPWPWLRPLEYDPEVSQHGWAQFWLRYEEEAAGMPRNWLIAALRAEGIPLLPGWPAPNYSLAMYTPERAAAWLRARGSGREPDHYLAAHCPHAERWAFSEALLLDLPMLEADPTVAGDFAAALERVGDHLAESKPR